MTSKPINVVHNVLTPALYMVSDKDTIAQPEKVRNMHDLHASKLKYFHLFPGEHASERMPSEINRGIEFLQMSYGKKDLLNKTLYAKKLMELSGLGDQKKARCCMF